MDQLTLRVWKAVSHPDSISFFLELLEGATEPEVSESLRDWFLNEAEKIEWNEDVPSILQTLLSDSLDLVDWDLVAKRWGELVEKVEESRRVFDEV